MIPSRHREWIRLLLLGALILAPACDRPSKPVARVEGEWVGQPQWQAFRADLPAATTPQAALDKLVRREVAWSQARRTGLLLDENWLAVAPQLRRSVLIRAYLDARPGQPPATEEALRASFFADGEERHVRHLLCATQAAAAAARIRLEKGESFDKVADAVSKDPSAAENHGDLGWIKRGAMVPEFQKAVFGARAGELCGPFQTHYGWHVARVDEIRAPKPEDFDRVKAQLRDEAHDLVNAPKRAEAIAPLKAKYPLRTEAAVLMLDQTVTPAPGDAHRIAGRIGDAEVSLAELKAFMADAVANGAMQHTLSPAIKTRFLELMGDDIRLAQAAEQAGFAKRPEVQGALWQAERKAIFNAYSLGYLRKLKPADGVLAQHLAQYPDRFKGVGSVKVYLLVAKDPASAAKAVAEGQKGTAWPKLVDAFGDKEATGDWNPGFLEVAALKKVLPPEAVKLLADAPLDAIIGPFQTPDGPMIFKVLERRTGGTQTLDQCRDEVREDYLRTHGAELVDQYLDGEGRKGLEIKVYPENAGL
ncbi:MAG TPA: peptidyl-prolyl cis-trans isomerase [Holophagaceae bacterium]|nr:peptidyl-prolyl cis-trans isomerase [Holophagaceae bacterium]